MALSRCSNRVTGAVLTPPTGRSRAPLEAPQEPSSCPWSVAPAPYLLPSVLRMLLVSIAKCDSIHHSLARAQHCLFHRRRFGGQDYFEFEALTVVPIQKKMMNLQLMTPSDVLWVDTYHRKVRSSCGLSIRGLGNRTEACSVS